MVLQKHWRAKFIMYQATSGNVMSFQAKSELIIYVMQTYCVEMQRLNWGALKYKLDVTGRIPTGIECQ